MAPKSKDKNDGKTRNFEALTRKYQQRITFAKNGKDCVNKNDFVNAIKNYNQYFAILADSFDVDINALRPDLFDQKRDLSELLLISQINWELSKIYDRAPNLKSEFNKCLAKFVLFTINKPFQVANAEMIRKFIEKERYVNKQEFKDAYKKIAINSKKCFIATQCYGYQHYKTEEFRKFKKLFINNNVGVYFIQKYYQFSPKIINICEKSKIFNVFFVKIVAKPILNILYHTVKNLKYDK
jgi:hypothetical protein